MRHDYSDAAKCVTVSCGIALHHQPGDSSGSLIENADHALYAAKSAGRETRFVYTRSNRLHWPEQWQDKNCQQHSGMGMTMTFHALSRLFSGPAMLILSTIPCAAHTQMPRWPLAKNSTLLHSGKRFWHRTDIMREALRGGGHQLKPGLLFARIPVDV